MREWSRDSAAPLRYRDTSFFMEEQGEVSAAVILSFRAYVCDLLRCIICSSLLFKSSGECSRVQQMSKWDICLTSIAGAIFVSCSVLELWRRLPSLNSKERAAHKAAQRITVNLHLRNSTLRCCFPEIRTYLMWRQSTCQRLYTGICFNSVSLHRTRTAPWIMGGQVMRLANIAFQLSKTYSVLKPCHVGEWDTANLVSVQDQANTGPLSLILKKWKGVWCVCMQPRLQCFHLQL